MIPINFTNLEQSSQSVQKAIATGLARQKFDRAYKRGWLYKFWALLTQCSAQMLNLQKVKTALSIRNRHYKGIRTVLLDQIRGSENRPADFDVRFNPLRRDDKARWINVASAMLLDINLPPVELIQIGDTYFVRDGHHRVSAARALGQEEIDAIVTTWDVNWRSAGERSLPRLNREVTRKIAQKDICKTVNTSTSCVTSCCLSGFRKIFLDEIVEYFAWYCKRLQFLKIMRVFRVWQMRLKP